MAYLEIIKALKNSLDQDPSNIDLRKHIAQLYLNNKQFEFAETEYQAALSLSPNDFELKLGLAEAFYYNEKMSATMVILEELLAHNYSPPNVLINVARLSFQIGEFEQARTAYLTAIKKDISFSNVELEQKLNIRFEDEESDDRVLIPVDESINYSETKVDKPKITFKDVGGIDNIKDEIRLKIIHPMKHPEIYQAYGKKIGGGILMYGPPGCGKTYLARATAGEAQANFIAVGIHDILNMYLGQSESNLHELFEFARENTPCILFFDEVDALGASRSDMKQSGGRQIINQFLSELDGIDSSNDGILVLAATNAPWHLDSAFRRPGRFDRMVFVPPPDLEARGAIINILLKDKPTDSVNTKELAKKSDGFSGADLKASLDIAIENKLMDAIKAGRPEPLTTKDILSSMKKLKPSTQEWFSIARNYAVYSNQSGIYDDILNYLNIKK